MNNGLKKIIALGLVCGGLIKVPVINSYALENNFSSYKSLEDVVDMDVIPKEDGSIFLEDGKQVIREGDIVYIVELIDVSIEEDQKLIDAGLLDSNYKDEILKQSNKNLRATERVQVWYGSPLKKSHRIESYQLDGTFNFAITETSTLYVNSSKQIRVLVSLSNLNQGVATVTSKSTSNGNYVGTGSTSQGSATINYKLPSGKTYVANPKFSVKNLGYGPGTDTFSIIADYTYTK